MKITLLTLGTRGDVQPFAVLGKALKMRGHDVTISSAANFSPFINSYDLTFVAVDADFQEILNSEEGKKMMSNPFSARKHLTRLIYPMIENALATFYEASKGSDLVLFHVKAMADYFADALPCKFIRTNVVPAIEPTTAFCNPIISFLRLPSFLNRASYKLSDLGMKMMSTPIKKFRRSLGLVMKHPKQYFPSIYGLSTHFLPRPEDYPSNCHFTGFWLENSTQDLDPETVRFIDNGPPPLLLTFGSMPYKSDLNLPKTADRLTTELETRLIIVRGWGLNDTTELEQNPNIRVVNNTPYDKLLPKTRAVIHHGGIGTIAECLRAGKPFLTCPILYPFGDQHFWGNYAYKKGVGLKPAPLKKLSADSLVNLARELLDNKELYVNSEKMMNLIRKEDGVANAIDLIESMR